MANSLSASFKKVWANAQQEVFYETNRAMQGADISFKAQMKKGQQLERTYRSSADLEAYDRDSDINITDITDTGETLTVNGAYANGFYVDDLDQIQDEYDIAEGYGKDFGQELVDQIDTDFFGEVSNADNSVDDGDIGGTTGNGIALGSSNLDTVIGSVKKKFRKQNVPMGDIKGFVSPEFMEVLELRTVSRDTPMGDAASRNGYMGEYRGIKFYDSNLLANTAVLAMATQVTADDTVSVNGVTFTYKASPAAAGEVDIGADVDGSRANLAAAINGGAGAGSTYIEVSAANRKLLLNVTATNDDTANTLTVYVKGAGVLSVSETLTDATDEWTAATRTQENLFVAGRAPVMVVQKMPMPQYKSEPKKLGGNILQGVLYGFKSFRDNKKRMCKVSLRADNY